MDGASETAQPPLAPLPLVPPSRGLPLLIGMALVAAAPPRGDLVGHYARARACRATHLAPGGDVGCANTSTLTDNQRHIAIMPDGLDRLRWDRGTQLFVRWLESAGINAGLHTLSPGAVQPADSQWIGFTDAGQLKKVAVSGGPVVAIATLDAPTGRGATWGVDDTIIYATTNGATGLLRVNASGGSIDAVTSPDPERGEADHIWPEWLPGGHAVLFTITFAAGGLDAARVAVLDLRTNTRKVLFAGSHAFFVADARAGNATSGHLLFMTAGTLWAVGFDAARLETQGSAVAVLRDVVTTAGGEVDAVVAGDGTLAYRLGRTAGRPGPHAHMGGPAGSRRTTPGCGARICSPASLTRRHTRGRVCGGSGFGRVAGGCRPSHAHPRHLGSGGRCLPGMDA